MLKGSSIAQVIVVVFIIGAFIFLMVKGIPKTKQGFNPKSNNSIFEDTAMFNIEFSIIASGIILIILFYILLRVR